MRRLLRGLVGSALIAATVITAVGAHSGRTPTAGASKAFTNDQVLTYGYGATTYPSWVYTVGNGVLTSLWVDPAKNNSHMPTLSQVAPNTGRIYFSPSSTSPCSGSLEWLPCARNTRMTNWEIYIRNFALAPHPVNNWHWYDTTNSCQATGLCFYARRTMLHETLHAVLVGGSHDEQGEDDTIMGSTSPWASNTGWNKTYIERCDHAAAQLKYGVKNSAGVYADCFLNITNHGPAGLKSRATVGSSSYSACIGATATATGRLAIATDSTNYQALSNTPLSNRTLWFDRKPSTSSTWTNNVTSTTASNASGNNWSKGFSSGSSITYNFRAHYDGETGVDGSRYINWPGTTITETTFSITWSSAC